MGLTANKNKNIEIKTTSGIYLRGVIKTHFISIGENYIDLMKQYVLPYYEEGDVLSISEKVISLCQKRIVYKKDMRISLLAKILSGFASHSVSGTGVDNVWKMQFAIDHAGGLKILWASICSGIGKLFGHHGIFYEIAGKEVSGLDGFYDKAFKEYGDFGIMLPSSPSDVCNEIYKKTGIISVIVDANDFACDILGECDCTPYTDEQLKEILRDNPSGQSDQLTPFVMIRKKDREVQCAE